MSPRPRSSTPIRGSRESPRPRGRGAPSTLPEVAFARTHGYSLRRLERCSVVRIREAGGGLGAEDEGDDGYTILTWAGPTPEEHLEALALLHRRMSTDTPGAADLEEEEFWDADRVRANDADREASGKRLMTALAMKGDEVAGYTQAAHFADRPEVGDQGGTLVIREHRGHRLGARLKRANHEALLAGVGGRAGLHVECGGEHVDARDQRPRRIRDVRVDERVEEVCRPRAPRRGSEAVTSRAR